MNAEVIARAVSASCPVPADIFGRAKWMGEAAEAAGSLLRYFQKEEKALIGRIQAEGMSSDEFQLTEVYRPYARVNTALLREREEAVFQDIVHVRAADAMHILTPKRVYALMEEVLGAGISAYEVVTVTDLRRVLPAAEAKRYILEGEEFVKMAVVEKEE